MPDFTVRSDSVNVEQLMEQIRARIREKRGVDYTEQQIQDLAAVKLEKFLDPRGVRSDLLDQFRRAQPPYEPPNLPNYAFEEHTLFESHRGPLRLIRKLLNPILKLFFNPNPLIQALHIQSELNTKHAEREARREAARHTVDQLQYEVLHNLVVETTRLGIEIKNLKMRVESLTSRLEFNERRARSLESAVVYKPEERSAPQAPAHEPRHEQRHEPRHEPRREAPQAQVRESAPLPGTGPAAPAPAEGPGQRSRRRRRRRGRRGGASAGALMGGEGGGANPQSTDASPHVSDDVQGQHKPHDGEAFDQDERMAPDGPDANDSEPSDQDQ